MNVFRMAALAALVMLLGLGGQAAASSKTYPSGVFFTPQATAADYPGQPNSVSFRVLDPNTGLLRDFSVPQRFVADTKKNGWGKAWDWNGQPAFLLYTPQGWRMSHQDCAETSQGTCLKEGDAGAKSTVLALGTKVCATWKNGRFHQTVVVDHSNGHQGRVGIYAGLGKRKLAELKRNLRNGQVRYKTC